MSEPVDGDERAATLRAAMVAARERKTSPAARVALLIVTGVAFVFVIGWDFNLVQVVLFLAVFLLHEAGHALGMFIFGYKNVSLFFVPFLGALITGRKENAPAWQEAVMVLMGPIPGLVLGLTLAPIAAGIGENQNLNSLVLFLIFINGLNMLPFVPLDGGHFCNLVVFNRNRYLEAAFSVFGIAGLVALAIYLRWWALGVLIFFMVPAVVRSIRIRSIAHELAKKHDLAVRDSEQEPDDELLLEINDAVQSRLKLTTDPEQAVAIDAVFRVARQRPPTVLATIALLLVYLAPIPVAGISLVASVLVMPTEQPSSTLSGDLDP